MRLANRLAGALLFRRLARSLDRLAEAIEGQQTLLLRLVDHLAPNPAPPERDVLRADTGLSYLDDEEAGQALAFIERTRAATGHTPDDEEVIIHLADEKTQNLAERLSVREAELARLAESRL
jgi:hypothetical protein